MPARLLPLAAAILFAAAPLAARAADACNLLSTTQISSVTKDPVTHTGPGPSNCIWSGAKDSNDCTWTDAEGPNRA